MYIHNDKIYIEETDQCDKCSNAKRCPLLEALMEGVIVITEEMSVVNCGFFEEREKGHLRIVK